MPATPEKALPQVSREDYIALASFRHAIRTFISFSSEAARAEKISPRQHQALLAIKGAPEHPALSVGELAEQLCLKHNSTVGLINRLVSRKLLKRSPGAEDRRKVYVELTAHGEALIRRLSSAHRNELRKISPKLRRLLETLDAAG